MQSGRWKKLAIAGRILIVGIGTALVFRREQSAEEPTSAKVPENVRRSAADSVAERKSQPEPALAGRIEPYSLHDRADQNQNTSASFTSATLDPALQSDSPLKWQTVRRPDHTGAAATIEPDRTTLDRRAADNRTIASPPAAVERHKIVDGDTLAALARRYLGTDQRSPDLFEFNRDVLITPELLPIGKELRIPPRDYAPARVPAVESQSRELISVAEAVAATPKRDIASDRTAGPPITAAKSPAQTYVVQQHDTLPLIARKLYGDISRQGDLMAANRQQLRSGKDLRPGMTLVVPAAPEGSR